MASTPLRLTGPAQLAGTAATIYTVPASTKTVLRHIHLSNPSGGPIDVTISIGTDAAALRLFDGFAIAADSTYDWWTYVVLEAAEIVEAFASSAATVVYTINGDERTL
jgi:hypothetical protein